MIICGWLFGCPCLFARCCMLLPPSVFPHHFVAVVLLQVLETVVNGIENMGGI